MGIHSNIIITVTPYGDSTSLGAFSINVSPKDTDNDGVYDYPDAFPDDADEIADTDSDGIGDNQDLFPNDPAKSIDIDNQVPEFANKNQTYLLGIH